MRIIAGLFMLLFLSTSYAGYLPIGHEADGRKLYLCRVNYMGSEQPGKTWKGYDKCNFAYGGHEIYSSHYSMYGQNNHQGSWRRGDGHIPRGAMVAGHDVNGKTLYLCRAYYAGGVQPGKTWRDYQYCNVPYAGRETLAKDYEIFVTRPTPHRHHRAHRNHAERQCLKDNMGNQACGYGCVKSMKGVKCASHRGQQCMADDFGNISCGYNCVKTMKGVFCAKRRYETCVSNAFGDVKCGNKCSVNSFGQFACH